MFEAVTPGERWRSVTTQPRFSVVSLKNFTHASRMRCTLAIWAAVADSPRRVSRMNACRNTFGEASTDGERLPLAAMMLSIVTSLRMPLKLTPISGAEDALRDVPVGLWTMNMG